MFYIDSSISTHDGYEFLLRMFRGNPLQDSILPIFLEKYGVNIMLRYTFILMALVIFIESDASAAERRCDGAIVWETTGGTVKGTLDQFTGVGKCGDSVPNRCRKRARAAIEQCAKTQYSRRWEHYPTDNRGVPTPDYDRAVPEACLGAAGIEGYTMQKFCEKHPTDNNRVCNNEADGRRKNTSHDFVEVSKPGNIKHALEASVCCLKGHGIHPVSGGRDYSNPSKVHVRLKVLASNRDSNKHCKLNVELEDDYIIDCTSVRANLCSLN